MEKLAMLARHEAEEAEVVSYLKAMVLGLL